MAEERVLPFTIYHLQLTNLSLITRHRNHVFPAAPPLGLGEADCEHAVFERGRGPVPVHGPAQTFELRPVEYRRACGLLHLRAAVPSRLRTRVFSSFMNSVTSSNSK